MPKAPLAGPPVPPPGELGRTLEKYIQRGLHPFKQIDVFAAAVSDCVFHPDKDGDAIFTGQTWETMSGGPTIRVLILPDADVADVLRGLRKVRKWIKRDAALLKWRAAGAIDEGAIPF